MNALVLIVGLITGDVTAEEIQPYVMGEHIVMASNTRTDTRTMTDAQVNEVYMTPEGWDPVEWANAVRSLNLSTPAGRR